MAVQDQAGVFLNFDSDVLGAETRHRRRDDEEVERAIDPEGDTLRFGFGHESIVGPLPARSITASPYGRSFSRELPLAVPGANHEAFPHFQEGTESMLIPATHLRVGMIILHQNDLWRVMQVVHVTPGNWRGMVQTKLRNLRSGSQTEYRFRSEDKADRQTLEQHDMEYLYESDGQYHFMNTENFEQIALEGEMLGDAVHYLTPNCRIQIEFHEGKP